MFEVNVELSDDIAGKNNVFLRKIKFPCFFLIICYRILIQCIVFSGGRGVCMPSVWVLWHG